MKKLLIIALCFLSGCSQISSLGSGTTMSRIQFPQIFMQQSGYNYGINLQCPPGKLSDCVGGSVWSASRSRND